MSTFYSAMVFVAVLATTSAAQCPMIGGIMVPCSRMLLPYAAPVQAEAHGSVLPSDVPLFTAEQVAPDASPEHLALLNNPTWENAIDAALVSLYRNLRVLEATYLWNAARTAIVNDIETRYGMPQINILPFLQTLAQEWGLPTVDLSRVPPLVLVPGMDEQETAHRLSQALNGGSPYVATPKP